MTTAISTRPNQDILATIQDKVLLKEHNHKYSKGTNQITTMTMSTKPNQDIVATIQNKILLKEHTPENLHSLLVTCNPNLTLNDVFDDSIRMQAMRKLMMDIHPSNFPYHEDALGIFEDVQLFYDLTSQKIAESKLQINKRRRRKGNVSPTSVVELVVQCKLSQFNNCFRFLFVHGL